MLTNRTLKALLLAVSLALAGSAAPASARLFDLNADGSYLPAGNDQTQALAPSPRGFAIILGQSASASRVVHGNPDEQTAQTSAADTGRHVRVGAVQRCPSHGPCISPDSLLTQGIRNEEAAALGYRGGPVASTTGSPTEGSSTSGHSPRASAAASSETFAWSDAGIGAAVMLLLVSVGVGVAVMTRRQRHRVTAS